MIEPLDLLDDAAAALRARGLRAFAAPLVAAPRDFELGLAVTLAPEDTDILVSFNPRTRGPSAREPLRAALVASGFDPAASDAAFAIVPADRVTTVLGMTWRGGGPARAATLYLEEVSRFFAPAPFAEATRRLAAIAGAENVNETDRPGAPYIWALDLEPDRAVALKVYRTTDRSEIALRSVDSAWSARLGGGVPASGWILQRRYRRAGPPADDKVYKCYPYESGGPAPDEVEAAIEAIDPGPGAVRLLDVLGPLRRSMPTSLGVRLADGVSRYLTIYWSLARGSGRA